MHAGFTPETKEGQGPWFPANIPASDDAKDLISKLLLRDIARRMSPQEVRLYKHIRMYAPGHLCFVCVLLDSLIFGINIYICMAYYILTHEGTAASVDAWLSFVRPPFEIYFSRLEEVHSHLPSP